MAKTATTGIFIDKYHPKANNKCAISIRVTFKRKKRYYPTKYKLTPDEFLLMFTPEAKHPHKTTFKVLMAKEKEADDIIDDLDERFTWSLFENRYLKKTGDEEDLFNLLESRAKELRCEERISTAVTFECALSSIKRFHRKDKLTLDEIDVPFLKKYRKWMEVEGNLNKHTGEAKGNSATTIGIYLRNVRYIMNRAIKQKTIPEELYPFGSDSDKFKIPTGKNIKKALRKPELQMIANYLPNNESQRKARDFWLFAFYGGGINTKDIALLKFKNMNGDFISFIRAKTKRENEDKPTIISFFITPEIKKIIAMWGNKSLNPNEYIFPILKKECSAEEVYKKIHLFTSFTNDHMKEIGKSLGISVKITTYVGRHSVGTYLRDSGASTEEVKETYGHGNILTTENYFASIELKSKKRISNILSNLTNNNNLQAV